NTQAAPVPAKTPATVKAIRRAEWCRVIFNIPLTGTPLNENARGPAGLVRWSRRLATLGSIAAAPEPSGDAPAAPVLFRRSAPGLLPEGRQAEVLPDRGTRLVQGGNDEVLQRLDTLFSRLHGFVQPHGTGRNHLRTVVADRVNGGMDDGDQLL